MTILNEDLLNEDLIEDLILFDHPLTLLSDSKAPNPSAEFLENISKLQEHVRRKGSWYSKDYVLKLKDILNKYPDKKSVIRKALNIPPTSFGRLLKEIRSSDTFWFIPKWRSRARDYITKQQKAYVEKLVKPPWKPQTISSKKHLCFQPGVKPVEIWTVGSIPSLTKF